MINGGETAMLSVPGLVPLRGGVPVTLPDGQMCGALGIGGGRSEQDETLANDVVTGFVPG